MPQSLSYLLTHIIFSTKDRAPVLTVETRPTLYAYLATVARNMDCECFRVGGVSDHAHLAVRLSRTLTMAKLIEELKTTSSKWLKTQSTELADFAWQRGYGAFSVGPSDLSTLLRARKNAGLQPRISLIPRISWMPVRSPWLRHWALGDGPASSAPCRCGGV